jgi:hypothetical protein
MLLPKLPSFHITVFRSEYQMDVTRYKAPCIDLHPFILSAKIQTLNHSIAIGISGKYINPINSSETDKI